MKKVLSLAVLAALSISTVSAQKLIVRMDDIGATHSENIAVIKAYQEGIGRSAEIMPVCPWYKEAAKMVNENPGLDLGIHIAFNSEWSGYKWRPITHCPSICDEDGYLNGLNKDMDLKEVEAEMRAQIELGLKYCKNVSHVTDHMAWTFFPGMADMVKCVAAEYGLFYQGGKDDITWGVESLGIIMGMKNREQPLLDLLAKMQKGHTYWVIEHPAIANQEMEGIYIKSPEENIGGDRQDVTNAFCSPKVMQYIKDHGIELINFKQAHDAAVKK